MIRLENVTIKYGRLLFDSVSINIPRGCVTLIKGASGIGKTSLLYRVGLISADQNYKYYIDDFEIIDLGISYIGNIKKKYISFVLQDNSLFEQYDVIGNLKLYAAFNDNEYTDSEYRSMLKKVHLNISFDQSIATLSGGEKQRLAIACALCKDTELIILDEPTAALDQGNEELIFNILQQIAKSDNKYIVIASHSKYVEKFSEKIYLIEKENVICIKDFHEGANKTKNIFQEKEIGYQFYYKYVKYFIEKYKRFVIILLSILYLSLAFMSGSLIMIDKHMETSKESLTKLSDNQLFITKDKTAKYINEKIEPFNLNNNYLFDKNVEVFPFVKTVADIRGEKIYIIPYFKYNDLMTKEVISFGDEGMYLSYPLYRQFANQALDFKNIQMDIFISDNKDEYIEIKDKEYKVKGVLKDSIKCDYLNNENLFIYMDYTLLKEMYEENQVIQGNSFEGYTIFSENFDDYAELINNLDQTQLGVNVFFDGISEMQTMIDNLNIYKWIIVAIVIIITILLFSTVWSNYFYKRKKEFALLKTNGIDDKGIFKLVIFDFLCQVSISVGTYIISLYALNMFVDLGYMGELVFINFIMILVVIVIVMIFSRKYIINLIPEKIFRQ